MKKSALVNAAKELNKVMGLDPQIKVKEAGVEELKAGILEAAEFIQPADTISQGTLDVITALKLSPPAEDPKPEKQEPPADPPKEGQKPASTSSGGGNKPPTEKKPTKKGVIEEMLVKGATIEDMAKKIVDLGIDADYDKNCRIVKLWLSKMGFDVKKDSITKNPIFKKK